LIWTLTIQSRSIGSIGICVPDDLDGGLNCPPYPERKAFIDLVIFDLTMYLGISTDSHPTLLEMSVQCLVDIYIDLFYSRQLNRLVVKAVPK